MARIPKDKRKKREHHVKHARFDDQSFEWHNGAGCEPHNIRCENCTLVQPGGEQYHVPGLQITPCFNCGNLVAHYEPQLRQST